MNLNSSVFTLRAKKKDKEKGDPGNLVHGRLPGNPTHPEQPDRISSHDLDFESDVTVHHNAIVTASNNRLNPTRPPGINSNPHPNLACHPNSHSTSELKSEPSFMYFDVDPQTLTIVKCYR